MHWRLESENQRGERDENEGNAKKTCAEAKSSFHDLSTLRCRQMSCFSRAYVF